MPIDTDNIIYAVASDNAEITITTNNVGWWDVWDTCLKPDPPKHFNCKRCGAPNQIGVCKYCGCAAED